VSGYQETPNLRLERTVCILTLTVALLLSDWLVGRIWGNPNQEHLPEFVSIAALLALAGYMGWLIYCLSNVRYQMDDRALVIKWGFRNVEVQMNRVINLYRWRRRWMWTGTIQSETGVEEIDLFPPVWVGTARQATWVLVYEVSPGERRAVALRPSSALLARLKAWAWELQRNGGPQ
jgi:hypothetical protein